MYEAFSNGTSFVSSAIKGESVVDSNKEYVKSEEKGINILLSLIFSYLMYKAKSANARETEYRRKIVVD